jgi:hypothetical protein
MIIGSASDTGSNRGVDLFVRLIEDIARARRLPPFKMAAVYAEVSRDEVLDRLRQGRIAGLGGRPDLTPEVVERTDHVVAMMGAEPIMRALDGGADVVICGRSCDDAIFAALPLRAGFPRALAFHLGKVLECASLCAEPFMAKETVLGTITPDAVEFEPMHPEQRCTPASVISHSMYEREDPYTHAVPGGVLDLRACRYEALDGRRTRVTGARWIPAGAYAVKLEGAGRVGSRAFAFAALRDPHAMQLIDQMERWARAKVEERHGLPGPGRYELFFRVFGRDGVLGAREPSPRITGHEVALLIEAVAPTDDEAMAIATLAQRNFFFARFPGLRGTAGTAALPVDEVLLGRPAYSWTINHLLPLDDPCEVFPMRFIDVGAARR